LIECSACVAATMFSVVDRFRIHIEHPGQTRVSRLSETMLTAEFDPLLPLS
jgi:hypothetical protein